MAAVLLASCPAIAISGFILFMVTTKYNKKELDAYAKAGDVAEEVLSSIRTVTAFGGQDWLGSHILSQIFGPISATLAKFRLFSRLTLTTYSV